MSTYVFSPEDPLVNFFRLQNERVQEVGVQVRFVAQQEKQGEQEQLLILFCAEIWDYYKKNKRDFAWRQTQDPYQIVVSEIMLQQTQTQRVAQKFPEFIAKFPTFQALAQASFQEVVASWVGLGYNRRARALHTIAQLVVEKYGGLLPGCPKTLETFPGLGPATAGSIVAFAYNKPTVFIETNIRSVFLHVFFPGQQNISDKILLPLIACTVDQQNPREWYYALMDYGVCIKKLYPNPSRNSKHHTMQSTFEGSDRQIRGAIVRKLAQQKSGASLCELSNLFPRQEERVGRIIQKLCLEKFIFKSGVNFVLPD